MMSSITQKSLDITETWKNPVWTVHPPAKLTMKSGPPIWKEPNQISPLCGAQMMVKATQPFHSI